MSLKKIKAIAISLVIGAVAIAVTATGLEAGQKAWVGGTSTDWNDGANWNPAGVPGVEDTVTVGAAWPNDSVVISSGAKAVCKRLIISAGDTVALKNSMNLDVGNRSIFITGALLVLSSSATITNAGGWSQTGTYAHGNGTVTFDSTGVFGIGSQTTFYRLIINKTSQADTIRTSWANRITIDDSLCVVQGVLAESLSVSASVGTRKFAMASGGKLRIKGGTGFPAGFSVINLDPSSTVEYAGDIAQTVSDQASGGGALSYGNLTFASLSGANRLKTAAGALDVNGTLTLGNGTQFAAGALTHAVAGNWTVAGNGNMTGAGTIVFDGSGFQSITAAATFSNNVTCQNAGVMSIGGATTITGNLYVTNNTQVNTAVGVTVQRNLTVDAGSSYLQTAGTLTLNGAGNQIITPGTGSQFNRINFDNGAPNAKKVIGNLSLTNLFYVYNDAVYLDSLPGQTHTIAGGILMDGVCHFRGTLILTGGTIYTNNAASSFTLDDSCQVVIAGNVAIQVGDTVNVKRNVTINSGYLVVDNNAVLAAFTADETLSVGSGTNLYIRGTDNFPTGFVNIFATTSITRYDANMDQTVRGNVSYGSLLFGNNINNDTHTKTADGPLDVNNLFYLRNCVSVDLGGYSHTIAGNIDNNAAGTTVQSTGTVTLDASDANQDINANCTYIFNNLVMTNASATASRNRYINADLTVNGNLNISNAGGSASYLLNVYAYGYNLTNDGGDTCTVGANCVVYTNGVISFRNSMASFLAANFDANSTVNYNLNNTQLLANICYGNLQFGSDGNKTAVESLDIRGSISRTGGAPVFVDNGYNHTVGGDWQLAAAYYPTPTGTITLNGADQNISATNFYDLVIAGTGTKTLLGAIVINDSLTINDGVTFDASVFNINIRGNWHNPGTGVFTQSTLAITYFDGANVPQAVTSNAASAFGNFRLAKTGGLVTALTDFTVNGYLRADSGNFDMTGRTITVGGDASFYARDTLTATGSTLVMNGTVTQYLRNYSGRAIFNNLYFSGTGLKYLADNNFRITGSVTIDNATLNGGNNLLDTVGGDWNNNGVYQHTGAGTVIFNGANQTISTSAFNNVTFAGTNVATLGGSITLNGSLTIAAGETLDVSTGNYPVSVNGNWTNNGAFIPRSGMVTFTGNNKTLTTGGSGASKAFHDVVLNMTSGQAATLAGDLGVGHDLTITSGTLTTSTYNVTITGNLANSGTFNHSNDLSVLTFNAASDTHSINSGGSTLRNIVINAPGAVYRLSGSNLTQNTSRTFTLTNGTFLLNGYTMTMNGAAANIYLNGGTFMVNAGAQLLLANTDTIKNAGGTFSVVGTASSPARVGRNGGGAGYVITQTAGTFAAKYYQFANTAGNGIVISGGSIDAVNNFSDGEFSGGSGSQYLDLTGLTFSDFTAANTAFNTGPTNNVKRTSGPGILTLRNAGGTLLGASYENDNPSGSGTTGFIRWSYNGKFWSGLAGDNNWDSDNNWNPVGKPTALDTVYLNHQMVAGVYTVNIISADAVAQRLILLAPNGIAITLVLNGYNLRIGGNLIINTNTTLTVTNATDSIFVAGSWANNGTFNSNAGIVVFNDTANVHTIAAGASAFNNVKIDSGSAVYQLAANLTINGNLTIRYTQLDVTAANYAITIAGNWADTGTGAFNPRAGTVTFNKTGATTQTISGGLFYNLTTTNGGGGTATKQIISHLTVRNTVTIGANTVLDGGTYTLYVGGAWNNNAGTSAFTQTGSGVVNFNLAGDQNVDYGTAATTFNYLVCSGTGTKYLRNNSTVNADVQVAAGVALDLMTFTLTGAGGSNSLTVGSGSTLRLRTNNFPTTFENISLSSGSTADYYSDAGQNIYAGVTYGNLLVRRINAGSLQTKTALGNLTLLGALTVNDVETQLDMSNDTLNLTGNLAFPAGGRQIVWGTTTGTLVHTGAAWNIDADITGFNNLVLSGSGAKTMYGNLTMAGSMAVLNGVTLTMQAFTMTCTGTAKTLRLQNGATLNCAIPTTTGAAFPAGFGTYTLGASSTVTLNAAVPQTFFATPTYGNVNFTAGPSRVTLSGNADINGNFNENTDTLYDAGYNLDLAGDAIWLTYYTASSNCKVTFDGADQTIGNNQNNQFYLNRVTFAGTGTKTLTDGGDSLRVADSLVVNSGVTVTTNRPINFSGASWTNNGTFSHTANTILINGSGAQMIDPGSHNAINGLVFAGTRLTTFVSHGLVVANGFAITTVCTVATGALTHSVNGNLTVTNGVLTSDSTNFTFGGAGQTIAGITARDITLSGTGTKTMGGDWSVRDLAINSPVTLTTTTSNYSLTVHGNWTNQGTFTGNTSVITFASARDSAQVTTGGSNFYDVVFDPPGHPVHYFLQSPANRISHSMTIDPTATVHVNSKTLILGSRLPSGLLFTVNGTLDINQGAVVKFNNYTSQCTLNVNAGGTIQVVGTSDSTATITREEAGIAGRETQININTGGTIKAKNYLIEYLDDNGLNVTAGATLDPTYNFSCGTWSNLRTAAGAAKRYLVLNAPTPGGSLTNVAFNFTGTPAVGTHYNVQRNPASTGVIQFAVPLSGNLAGALYEDDAGDLVNWPVPDTTTWTGALSRNWHTAGNWSSGAVPESTTSVTIPVVTNNPQINTADARCNNLTLTTGNLVLDNGEKLKVHGDLNIGTGNNVASLTVASALCSLTVAGSWTRGANAVFTPGGGTVLFSTRSSGVSITPLSSSFYHVVFISPTNATFSITGTAIDINGSLTIQSGTVMPATTNYNLTLAGDYANIGGTFNASITGTVTLDGAGQSVTSGTFYNLTASGTNSKTFSRLNRIANVTTVNCTLATAVSCTLDFNGNVLVNSSGVFNDAGAGDHTFAGASWINNGSYLGSGTITTDGAIVQYLGPAPFCHLVVGGTNAKLLQGNLTVSGNLTVNNTIAYLNLVTYNVTNTGTGTFTLPGINLYVRGANNFPSGFATYTLDTASVVYYDAAMDQTIGGNVTYGILNLNQPYAKTLANDIGVAGNFYFNSATLNSGNHLITIGGSWNNYNTGSFTPGTGEVTFNGAGTQYIRTNGTGTQVFYKLSVDKTAGTAQFYDRNQTVQNNLTVYYGTLTAGGYTITVGGDLRATSGTIATSGTFLMNKGADTASIQTNGSVLNHLTISGGAGALFQVLDNLTINGNFQLQSGTCDGSRRVVTLGNGANSVSLSGVYKVGPGGTLALGNGTTVTVNVGGEVQVVGASDSIARVTRRNAGTYTFQVNGGIQARNYLFEYMNASGIMVADGATIDAGNNFSNGTFANGVAGGTFLNVENSETLNISIVNFPQNPGGGASNVKKVTATAGGLNFLNATGVFAGEAYDNDPYNLINWLTPVTLTWTGALSTDWFTAGNWSPSSGPVKVPTDTEYVVIAIATNQPLIGHQGARARKVTINANTTLTVSTSDSLVDLNVASELLINGRLIMNTTRDTLAVKGSWIVGAGGTFTSGTGAVVFNNTSGTTVITSGNSAFYNLVIDSGGTYQLGAAITVGNDLTIRSGTFDVTAQNYIITVGGSWVNSGTFICRTGKVTFNAVTAGVRTLNPGASPFSQMELNCGSSAAVYQLTGNTLSLSSNLTITKGTLDLNGLTLNFGDGAGTDILAVGDTVYVDANASLKMGNTAQLAVNSGGVVKIVGTDADNVATVTRQSAGTYAFTVNAGGQVAAQYYLCEYMNSSGLQVLAGATIDTLNNFSNGTFSNGTGGGCYLELDNDYVRNDTVRSVVFNAGPLYNVYRVLGSGLVTFQDATGALAGPVYENDSPSGSATTGYVRWRSTSATYTWTGSTDTVWNTDSNWDDGLGGHYVPDTTVDVIIPDVSGGSQNNPVLASGTDGSANNLTINNGGRLTLRSGKNLLVKGSVSNSGTITVVNGSASTLTVRNAWTNYNTFSPGNSATVAFTAASGTKTINAGASPFCHLTLNGNATFKPAQNLNINGDFNLLAGTFDVTTSNYRLNVAGNWSNAGTFVKQQGTVVFDSTGQKTVTTGGSGAGKSFYNLTINRTTAADTDTITLSGKCVVANNLTLTNGTLAMGTDTLCVGGNWNNTAARFKAGTGAVEFDSSGTKTLSANSQSFNKMIIKKSSSGQITLSANTTVNDTMTIAAGTLFLNGKTLTFGNGAKNISITGTIYVDAGAYLKMYQSATATVNPGGTFKAIGLSSSNRAMVTSQSTTPGWSMVVNGAIQAYYATFAYSGDSGIAVTSSGTIHNTNNFSRCRFRNGKGTAYLTLANNQNVTMDSVLMDSASANRCTYNIRSVSGTGTYTFINYTGTLAQEAFENDDGGMSAPGRIIWAAITLKVFGVSKSPGAVWPYNYYHSTSGYNVDMLEVKFYAMYDSILIDTLVVNLGGLNADTSDVDTVALFTDVGGNAGSMIAGAFKRGFSKSGSVMYARIKPTSPLVVPKNDTLRVHVVFDIKAGADSSHDIAARIERGDSVKCRPKTMTSRVTISGTFPIMSNDMSLPVELTAFSAIQTSNSVVLKWRTESESENLGFNVYRSSGRDGYYQQLNTRLISGAGWSETSREYSFEDYTVYRGTVYWYKIADVDMAGVKTYHQPIMVMFNGGRGETGNDMYLASQNPFTTEISLKYFLRATGDASFTVFTSQGEIVQRTSEQRQGPGWQWYTWNGRDAAGERQKAGVYVVEIKTRDLVKRKSIMLLGK